MQRGDEVYVVAPRHWRHLHRGIAWGQNNINQMWMVVFDKFIYAAFPEEYIHLADDMPF